MSTDVGRGILAPRSGANIRDGAAEMRTLGATAAAAINDTELRISGELATKIGKTEAYENLVPRDEAAQYGIEGPRGPEGPRGKGDPGPAGPGGSIALEETDPGCFVDSEITWMQWDNSVGPVARAWNPNTETYHMIHGDTGRREITNLFDGTAPNATSPIAGGQVFLTRVGRLVEIIFENVTLPEGHSTNFVGLGDVIPRGFQPPREIDLPSGARMTIEAEITASLRINRLTGRIYVYQLSSGATLRLAANYFTEDPWPTSLPGLPA